MGDVATHTPLNLEPIQPMLQAFKHLLTDLVSMSPTVSVVVPVFNGMGLLAQSVDSILTQSHSNLDVVLVDGGSTDGSDDWIRSVDDPRVRTMHLPAGTSAAENWTAASRAAHGDYVKLLCQDDVLYPRAIELQLADLDANPHASFAVAQRDIIDVNNRIVFSRRGCAGLSAGSIEGPAALRTSYLHGTNIFGEPLAVLFRRFSLASVLPWNDERPFLLDLELYTRLLRSGPIVVRRESIGAFRVSSSSWSTRLVRTQQQQLRSWQSEVAESLNPAPPTHERARAALTLRAQMLLRRIAYRILKARGAFESPVSG